MGDLYSAARSAGSTSGAAKALQMAADLGVSVAHASLPVTVRNLRTGRHQKAAGAWSWTLVGADGAEIIGSAHTLRDALSAHQDERAEILGGTFTPEIVLRE